MTQPKTREEGEVVDDQRYVIVAVIVGDVVTLVAVHERDACYDAEVVKRDYAILELHGYVANVMTKVMNGVIEIGTVSVNAFVVDGSMEAVIVKEGVVVENVVEGPGDDVEPTANEIKRAVAVVVPVK